MDSMGNAASVLQSTCFDWGSGVVAGDTGILWQNRGAAFRADRCHPNAFAPGKLPFYALTPGIALRDGRPQIVYGTQGADGQPQTLAMLLTRLIDFGQPRKRPWQARAFCWAAPFPTPVTASRSKRMPGPTPSPSLGRAAMVSV
jgi:gamma-glutamyltranspeptidase/glutathione hydrolase